MVAAIMAWTWRGGRSGKGDTPRVFRSRPAYTATEAAAGRLVRPAPARARAHARGGDSYYTTGRAGGGGVRVAGRPLSSPAATPKYAELCHHGHGWTSYPSAAAPLPAGPRQGVAVAHAAAPGQAWQSAPRRLAVAGRADRDGLGLLCVLARPIRLASSNGPRQLGWRVSVESPQPTRTTP